MAVIAADILMKWSEDDLGSHLQIRAPAAVADLIATRRGQARPLGTSRQSVCSRHPPVPSVTALSKTCSPAGGRDTGAIHWMLRLRPARAFFLGDPPQFVGAPPPVRRAGRRPGTRRLCWPLLTATIAPAPGAGASGLRWISRRSGALSTFSSRRRVTEYPLECGDFVASPDEFGVQASLP